MNDAYPWLEATFEVINLRGLHARAAVKVAQTLTPFDCDVEITSGNSCYVNALSVMGMMILAAGKGTQVKARARGVEAKAALDELATLFKDRFGEEA